MGQNVGIPDPYKDYSVRFDSEVSQALQGIGPNAENRLSRLFGDPTLGGGQGRPAIFDLYGEDAFTLDPNGAFPASFNVGMGEIQQLLGSGVLKEPQGGDTQTNFLNRILNWSPTPPSGGGGGGGGGGTGGGGGGGTGPTSVPTVDNFPGPGIPGPATDTLSDLWPLDYPEAGGPTFPHFGNEDEDELSRLINERLASIISGEGLPSTAAPGLDPRAQTGLDVLESLAQGQGPGSETGAAGIAGLESLLANGGVDPDLIFQVRQSLRENMEGELEAGREALMEEFAGRRLTGGGAEMRGRFDLRERLNDELNRNLRDFGTQLALSGSDRQLQAAQSLASLGQSRDSLSLDAASQLVSQGVAIREQDIQAVQRDLNAQLDAISTATGRALGVGDLALRSLVAEQDFVSFLMQQQISEAEFLLAAEQASSGNEQAMLQILLQYFGQLQQGQVA